MNSTSIDTQFSQAALLCKQPSQAAPVHWQLSDTIPYVTTPLARSRPALDSIPLCPLRSKPSSFQLPQKTAPADSKAAFELPVGRLPTKPSMVRSNSLIRLPSQMDLSMASLLPDLPRDDSYTSTVQQLNPQSTQALLDLPHRLVQASKAVMHPFQACPQDSQPPVPRAASGMALRGLTFMPATGRYHMDPHEALTMSEGSMQCAVTGDALEYLLQLPDVSLLGAVMRNAVVFSRMQVCSSAADLIP